MSAAGRPLAVPRYEATAHAGSISFGMWLSVGVLTLAGAALRLVRLEAPPASPAEAATSTLASGELAQVGRSAAVHGAPLAETLFWLLARFFGSSVTDLRWAAGIAAALALPLLWLAARRAAGSSSGMLTLALLAISPLAVATARAAEPQALALLGLAPALLAYERLRRHGGMLNWALFALAAVVATLAQYLNATLITALLVALLVVAERRRVESAVGGLVVVLLIVLCLTPLLANGAPSLGARNEQSERLFLADVAALAVGGPELVPGSLARVALAVMAFGGGIAFIDWRRWEGLLPYFFQIAALVALVASVPSLVASGWANMLLPSVLVCVSSGMTSLASVRFGWLLATALTTIMFITSFVALVNYFIAL